MEKIFDKQFDKQSVNQEQGQEYRKEHVKEHVKAHSQDHSQDHIKVRCPQCFKLYRVDFSSVALHRPKFQCTQCQEKFSLQIQDCQGLDEIIGFSESWEEKSTNEEDVISSFAQRNDVLGIEGPLDSLQQNKKSEEKTVFKPEERSHKELDKEGVPCPKCETLNPIGSLECKHCHVVIKKFVEIKKDPSLVNVPQKLKEIWQMVLNHYEDEDLHQEFIRQCRKLNRLEFAASRYKKILDAQPQEELALRFRREIVALASIAPELTTTSTKVNPIDKPKMRVPFTSIAMLLSSILMFVGYMTPEFRNLMGIGAAFLFITTAIRLIFK